MINGISYSMDFAGYSDDTLPDYDILGRSDDSLAFLGQTFSGREMWLDADQMTRHILVTGSTGSGKTELLLGMCANSIASGSGLLFVDGKGDISTFANIYALADKFGRRDDVLLLNFSQAPDTGDKTERFVSNTINPFQNMSADSIVQLMVGLMGTLDPRDSMWTGRAVAMITAVVSAAVWMRKSRGTQVSFDLLRGMCSLRKLTELVEVGMYTDMPEAIRAAVMSYLTSIPGFQREKGYKQAQTALDQHGYLEMQFTRIFSTMVDVYGHIFASGDSHIDMRDVVLDRRILVVMLPTLEKSSEEVSNLGRIVVALLKDMMATAMRAPIEGNWDLVVESRPTKADYPFLVILDEVSHYLTDGMSTMAGQARSLNFCMVFAMQDVTVTETISRKEFLSIMANTNTKIFMAMQNPSSHVYMELMPSNERYATGREDKTDKNRAAIETNRQYIMQAESRNKVLEHLRMHSRDEPEINKLDVDIRKNVERIAKLHVDAVDLHSENEKIIQDNPAWSLRPTLKKLQPGEFVVVSRGKFQRGRSVHVSREIDRPDIVLNQPVPYRATDEQLDAEYRPTALTDRFLTDLETADLETVFGQDTLRSIGADKILSMEFANVFSAPVPGGKASAKASIRRSFAVINTGKNAKLLTEDSEEYTL